METRSIDEMVAQVRAEIVESIRLRLRADVPVGIYLSGGIDSSAVAGIAKHLTEEGVKMGSRDPEKNRVACFCIAFDRDSGFDESGRFSIFSLSLSSCVSFLFLFLLSFPSPFFFLTLHV